MKPLNPRQRIWTYSGGILVGLFVLYLFVLIPAQDAVKERSNRIYQARINEETAKLQQDNATVSKAEYERLQSTTDQLSGFFVDEARILTFISSLESAASQAGVTENLQNLRAPEEEETSSSITITAAGTFPALFSFLQRVEALPTYVVIDHLSFSPGDGTTSLALTLQARIFWQ